MSSFTTTRHLSPEESRRHGGFLLFWLAGFVRGGMDTGFETLLLIQKVQSPSPETRCIDGGELEGCLESRIVCRGETW